MDDRELRRISWIAERVMRESAGPHANRESGTYKDDPLVMPCSRQKRKRYKQHCANRLARNAVFGTNTHLMFPYWWDDALPEEIPPVDWDVPF